MANPAKHIRKAIITALGGTGYKIYDTHNPNTSESAFIVLSNQSGNERWEQKCARTTNAEILIDIITRYPVGTGSRLLADNMMEAVLNATENLSIDGYTIVSVTRDFPSDLSSQSNTETIHRKFIRYNFKLIKQ